MFPRAISGNPPSGEHILDLLPGHLIDEWLVLPIKEQAFKADLALVVGLAQHAVDLRATQGLASVFQGFASLEATLFKCIAQGRDAPVTRGVLTERPADMRCPIVIDHHALDVGAVDAPGGVQVADRRLAGCATAANFLFKAFLSFSR
nr:hypothetical protein [Mycobacterium hackensackense]